MKTNDSICLSKEDTDELMNKVLEHQRYHPNHFSDDYRLELIEIIKASLTKCKAE